MQFILMVPRKEETDEFNVQEIMDKATAYHIDCGNAKANLRKGQDSWRMKCSRCDSETSFRYHTTNREYICKTAIDGEERALESNVSVRRRGNKKK